MNSLTEKTTASHVIYTGKILNLRKDEVVLPNGNLSTREVIEHPGAVAIVPVLDDGRIVFVRQYRHAVGKVLLEIPAGKLDKEEKPYDCASRELHEETGYTARNIERLTSIYTTPGFTNEIIHIYKATGLIRGKQALDEDEFINVEVYTPDEMKKMIEEERIIDAKTMIALNLAGI